MKKAVSVKEMRELDRKTIEEYGTPALILMERAGRGVAGVALRMLEKSCRRRVVIFCGGGNNGGDGMAAARYLVFRHILPEVYFLGKLTRLSPESRINYRLLRSMGIKPKLSVGKIDRKIKSAGLIIDAIFGVGLKGEVREPTASLIRAINRSHVMVLSIDTPSGLDCDSGRVGKTAVKADKTVTLAFPKRGFFRKDGPRYTGELLVHDIGLCR